MHLGSLVLIICMTSYIPFVQQQEKKSVKDQINGRQVSVIFCGTTHVCEALVIVITPHAQRERGKVIDRGVNIIFIL